MKTKIQFTICLFTLLLLFSNFSDHPLLSANFSALVSGPDLPETPFDYSTEFPAYLLAPENEGNPDFGLVISQIDENSFEAITDHGATLGRVLFYDEMISGTGDISCGSCHLQSKSFADLDSLSEGVNNATTRNSMHLNDIGWVGKESFFWDMRITDLKELIELPLTDENEVGADLEEIISEMEAIEYYPELFANAFGDAEITEDRIEDALVQFLESMTTFNSKLDKVWRDEASFTASEERGREVFASTCGRCHTQGDFVKTGDHPFLEFPFSFTNGLLDEDDFGVGEWYETDEFDHHFEAINLRNIEVTGPYMHDGRFETLEDVMKHYTEGIDGDIGNPLMPFDGFSFFSEQDVEDVINFMKTFTDHSFLTNEKWSDPFELETSITPNLELELSIYPNPSSDFVRIDLISDKSAKISVWDMSGRMVIQDDIMNGTYEISKSDLGLGTFTLEIKQNDYRGTRKVIIQ